MGLLAFGLVGHRRPPRARSSVDVLEAHLAAGDELVVLRSADLDLPELLGAPLVGARSR
jgi:hypothetical protein